MDHFVKVIFILLPTLQNNNCKKNAISLSKPSISKTFLQNSCKLVYCIESSDVAGLNSLSSIANAHSYFLALDSDLDFSSLICFFLNLLCFILSRFEWASVNVNENLSSPLWSFGVLFVAISVKLFRRAPDHY